MRASKWRAALIGDLDLIHKLRESTIIPPDTIRDQCTMEQDLKRTFPTIEWFNTDKHLNNISDILMAYAKVNPNQCKHDATTGPTDRADHSSQPLCGGSGPRRGTLWCGQFDSHLPRHAPDPGL